MTVRWRKSDKFVTIYRSWKSGKMDPAREVFLDLEPGAKWRHPRNRVDRMKCDAFRLTWSVAAPTNNTSVRAFFSLFFYSMRRPDKTCAIINLPRTFSNRVTLASGVTQVNDPLSREVVLSIVRVLKEL